MNNYKRLYFTIFLILNFIVFFKIEKIYALDDIEFHNVTLYKYNNDSNSIGISGTEVGKVTDFCSFNANKTSYNLKNINLIYIKPNIDCNTSKILKYLKDNNQIENNKDYYGFLKVEYSLKPTNTKTLYDVDFMLYTLSILGKAFNPLNDMYSPNEVPLNNNISNEIEHNLYMIHVDDKENVVISPTFNYEYSDENSEGSFSSDLFGILFASNKDLEKFNYYKASDINDIYMISDIEQESEEIEEELNLSKMFIPKQTVLFEPKVIDKNEFTEAKNEYGLTYYMYKCDINQDGTCNTLDNLLIEKYLNKTEELNKAQLIIADINDDGTVNDTDKEILSKYLSGWDPKDLEMTWLYSWNFNKNDIKNTDVSLNTGIKIDDSKTIEKIKKNYGDIEGTYLSFQHDGNFPGKSSIMINLGNKYEEDTKLNLYYFNDTKNELELVSKNLIVSSNYVTLEIEHASDYILTSKEIKVENKIEQKEENPQTSANTNYLFLGFVLVGGISIYIYSKKHSKFPQI